VKRVTVESVDSATFGDGVERRCLGRELASTDVAINHYGVPSGERLAGLHAHDDQEELFVVLEGRVVFETLGRRVEAAAGEAARFPPGEFQSCTNPDGAGGEAVVLALGAPRDATTSASRCAVPGAIATSSVRSSRTARSGPPVRAVEPSGSRRVRTAAAPTCGWCWVTGVPSSGAGSAGRRRRPGGRPDAAFITAPADGSGMLRDRTVRASLSVGLLAAAVAGGYGVATDLIRPPGAPGVLPGTLLLYAALLVVPFGLGAGAAFLALRHRVVLPLVVVAGFAAVPAMLGRHSGLVVVGVLVAGPFVAVVALAETLVRAGVGRLAEPPSPRGLRALSVGVMAAVVYFGVFAVRAVLPLWRIDTGVPSLVPPAVDLAVTLWYVLGASLVLVGLPVALNRRFGLLAPVVGLLAYLLVDFAFVQPAVANGTGLVVALQLGVRPTLAVLLAAVGAVEWWLRRRRGDYDEGGDDEDGGLSVEGGLLGDRV
jgi:mannose-6-phosphate isomerase-like protein (cupin superfamily)